MITILETRNIIFACKFKSMAPTLEQGNTSKVLEDEYYRKEEEENFSFAMQLVVSSTLPICLKSAIELGVFDIIAKAGEGAMLSPAEIAAQLPTTNPEAPVMLDRILRLLASYSVLGCSSASDGIKESNFQWLYSLRPVSKYFVTNEDGVSLGPFMVMIQDKIFQDSWHGIKNAVLEGGIPFNKVHGMHAFEYPAVDPRFNQVFNTGMYNHTTLIIKNTLKFYKGFEHLKQLVDVGGGLGVTLNLITTKYPHIKGINFDLPHVIKHAPFYTGIEHVGGDMFKSVPSGDAIFMKWILHDWSDEQCLKLLKNCYKAIPDNGKVIVMEAILPTVMSETSSAVKTAFMFDVGMMTQNPGGKERSREEFLVLATGAGFSGVRFECFVSNYWVMEFFK